MGLTSCLLLLLAVIAAPAAGDMKEQVFYGLPFNPTEYPGVYVPGVCVRLLNGTHQYGCGSSMNGDEGVIVYARSKMDLEGMSDGWKERFPDYDGGFVVLMKESMLDRSTAPLLMSSARVSGVLLIPSEEDEKIDKNAPLSEEAACPNRQTSLYSDFRACGSTASTQWNQKGAMLEEGLRFTDWTKPMTRLVNDTVAATMIKCHDEYNLPNGEARGEEDKGRLCSVSIKTFMQGTGSSEECVRRQVSSYISQLTELRERQLCDALDDYSVFAILPPGVQNKTAGGGYLAVMVRMDAVTMIPDKSPATLGTMSAVVAALTAAKVVGDNLDTFEAASKKSDKRIIFAFFHGESHDYIGSSRWVYDMEHADFPSERKKADDHQDVPELIGLDRISLALELQQIDDSTQLHAHVDGKNYDADTKGTIKKALETMSAAMDGGKVDTSRLGSKGVLPPSSLHAILKKNRQTPSLLLTSFGDQYTNRRLHSSYDRLTGGKQEEMAVRKSMERVAKGVVALLANHVGIEESKRADLKIDTEWLEMLSGCFIASAKFPGCDYLQQLFTPVGHPPADPFDRSTYILSGARPLIRVTVKQLMTIATGDHNSTTNVRSREACTHVEEKQALHKYEWQFDPWKNDTFCYRTSIRMSHAQSPAFIADGNGVKHVEGSNYSTWTQSRMIVSAEYQLFLVESRSADWIIVMAGVFTTLVALLIVGRCDDSSFIVDEGERAAEEGEPL